MGGWVGGWRRRTKKSLALTYPFQASFEGQATAGRAPVIAFEHEDSQVSQTLGHHIHSQHPGPIHLYRRD